MKIIIAGGRDFDDYSTLNKICNHMLQNQKEIEIVCGCARGADTLGEKYAKEHNYNIIKFPADWNQYNKAAGYIRNEEMAKYADALIAFWNGSSRGTKHMIDLAIKYKLKVKIHLY